MSSNINNNNNNHRLECKEEEEERSSVRLINKLALDIEPISVSCHHATGFSLNRIIIHPKSEL